MLRALFSLFVFCLLAGAPVAQTYPIQGVAALDILPGHATARGHMMAVRIRLKPGWKTYWRAPGGNGIPPRFSWTGSRNIDAVRFHWPAPGVFDTDGMRTIGYHGELVLPIEITATRPGQPIIARGSVAFGICEDVCIPAEARFDAELTRGGDAQNALIRAALDRQPVSPRKAGLTVDACRIVPNRDGFRVEARLRLRRPADNLFTVVEYLGAPVWAEQDSPLSRGRTLETGATLYAMDTAPLLIDRSMLRITVLGGAEVIEINGCPA